MKTFATAVTRSGESQTNVVLVVISKAC